jgi:cell division septal protein FtsQ
VGLRLGLAAIVLMLVCSGAGVLMRELYYENPSYGVKEIKVHTDGDLTRRRIMEAARVQEGENSLKVDLAGVRERLESLPQVRAAEVRRVLPDKIEIVVRERRPVARLEAPAVRDELWGGDRACLLDAEGVPFPVEFMLSSYLRLPRVVAPELNQVAFGERLASDYVERALKLLAYHNEAFYEEQFEVRSIEPAAPYSILVTYGNDARVTFGRHELGRQMADFLVIMDQAKEHGWLIDTLNLIVEGSAPVTFFQSPRAGGASTLASAVGAGASRSSGASGAAGEAALATRVEGAAAVALPVEEGELLVPGVEMVPAEREVVAGVSGDVEAVAAAAGELSGGLATGEASGTRRSREEEDVRSILGSLYQSDN